VVATRGFYVDVTDSVQDEVQREIGEKLDLIVTNRAIIEQAKGMLMAAYDMHADAAFAILRWRSQELNLKLHDVARQIVAELPGLVNVESSRGPLDHFLMTLNAE
jgi:hypothetical protein